MTISPEDAIRRYPELRTLVDLRAGGWSFLPVADDGQDLVGIVGYRNTAGYTDALWVFGEDDCRAVRLLPDDDLTGGIVWEHHGRLADCGHELLALPEPDDRHAPKLVRARLLLPDRPATGMSPGGS